MQPVDFISFERTDSVARLDRKSANHKTGAATEQTAVTGPVVARSSYRRQTFNRLHEMSQLSPAERPPLRPVTSREAPTTPQVDKLHVSGSVTHRKALKGYLDSMVEREAEKWQQLHQSVKVKEARSTDEFWTRLDAVHSAVHEGFKKMLLAGAHCMDLVLSVNGNNLSYLTTVEFVRLAAKLGVRTEEYEAESLFQAYGDREDYMDLETFGHVFINTEAIFDKTMAPALVNKLEGCEGARRIVQQEAQDAERIQRRLEVRGMCHELGVSFQSASELQKKMEKNAHTTQIQQGKNLRAQVKQAERLTEFIKKHADKFGGMSGDGKLLWKYLEPVRREEARGKTGSKNKEMRPFVKGLIGEWRTLVAGQAPRAQAAHDEIDKATKRLDQRTILHIVSKKVKFVTTSWIHTQRAGLVALGATSTVGDPLATQIAQKMLASNEAALREGACKLFAMILDPSARDIVEQIHKHTSRREDSTVRAAAKKAVADIMMRARDLPKVRGR